MIRPAPTLAVCSLLLASTVSCGTHRSFRLPLSAAEARGTFPPLAVCAGAEGLQAVEHPNSINVRYDTSTWVQFMIQNDHYNMVVIVDDGVPEAERPARVDAAKVKGDALYACSVKGGIPAPAARSTPAPAVEAPRPPEPAPAATPPTPSVVSAGCVSATAIACSIDPQCPTKNCTSGYCQGNNPGSLCTIDPHCASKNCTGGCCQTNAVGAQCSIDPHCTSKNCTSGLCADNTVGSACTIDPHCTSKNCTGGLCSGNDRGSACTIDSHCTSRNCTNAVCQ